MIAFLSAFGSSSPIFTFHCLFEKFFLAFGNFIGVIFVHMLQILIIAWHTYKQVQESIRAFLQNLENIIDSQRLCYQNHLLLHKEFRQVV